MAYSANGPLSLPRQNRFPAPPAGTVHVTLCLGSPRFTQVSGEKSDSTVHLTPETASLVADRLPSVSGLLTSNLPTNPHTLPG